MKNQWAIFGALFTVIFLWSSAFVGIRYALIDYHPGSLALLRFLVASLSMLFLYLSLPKRKKPNVKELISMLSLGVIGIGIYNLTLNFGELTISAGIASFIVSLIPVITLIFAVSFLKEPLTKTLMVGVIISLIGLMLMGGSELTHSHASLGLLLVFSATLCGAIFTVLQRWMIKDFHPIEVTSFVMWGGTLCFLIFTPELIHDFKTAHLLTTLTAIYLGVFPAAIAYAAWCYVLSHLNASHASLFLYLLPIVSTLMAFVLLHELPKTLSLIGGLIALTGALYSRQSA